MFHPFRGTWLCVAVLSCALAACGGPGSSTDAGEQNGGGSGGGGIGGGAGGGSGGGSGGGGGEIVPDAGDDGGIGADGGSGDDGGSIDLDAGADGGTDAGSTISPDGGACLSFPGDGVPTRVSANTRQVMDSPLVATAGGTTMAVWTASTNGRTQITSHWAAIDSAGMELAHGTLSGDAQSGQLFVLGGVFHYFSGAGSLYRFQSNAWSPIAGFSANQIAIGGGKVLGVTGSQTSGGVTAVVYDGNSVSTSTQVSTYTLGTVAADGSGGFALITVDHSTFGQNVVHARTFDGSSWSADATVITETGTAATLDNLVAAYGASILSFAYTFGNSTKLWMLSSGTWTSQTFTGGSSKLLMRGGPNTLCVAAENNPAAGYIYQAGTWAKTSFTGSSGTLSRIAGSGDRCAFAYGNSGQAGYVALFDGSAWSAPKQVANASAGTPTLTFNGNALAVGYGEYGANNVTRPYVALNDGTNWGTGFQLTTASSRTDLITPGIGFSGSDLIAAFSEPGQMRLRSQSAGTWGPASTLPMDPVSGQVMPGASIARLSNGHALATWGQWDVDELHAFAAEHDGANWSAPVDLGVTLGSPTVASNGTTFVLGWMYSDKSVLVARWNGSGVATPVNLGKVNTTSSAQVQVASDGTGFAAVWDNGTNLSSLQINEAESTDGTTWTTPAQLPFTVPTFVANVAGGPGGVIVLGRNVNAVTARVWKAGAWSAGSRTMNVAAGNLPPCRAAVSSSDAMFVCVGQGMDGQLYKNGAWADAVLTTSGGGVLFSLASDGVDYRVDFPLFPTPSMSAVYRNGAWTTPLQNPLVNPLSTFPPSYFTAGSCGTWTYIYVDGGSGANGGKRVLTRANGTAAYPAGTPIQGGSSLPSWSAMSSWPGEVDSLWTTDALYVALRI